MRPRWLARISKHIPVASGLGGGSSDAATALLLANATLDEPLAEDRLHELARRLGADVPFFLESGPQLGQEEGGALTPLDLPQDYFVLLLLPRGAAKPATAAVYEEFDRRNGADGYEARRAELLETVSAVVRSRDLAALPANDLASSPLADELRDARCVPRGRERSRPDGVRPVPPPAGRRRRAAAACAHAVGSWLTAPAWYG